MFGFGKVENTVVNIKSVGASHFISFHRCFGVIISLIIFVSPLVKTAFFFFQNNAGYVPIQWWLVLDYHCIYKQWIVDHVDYNILDHHHVYKQWIVDHVDCSNLDFLNLRDWYLLYVSYCWFSIRYLCWIHYNTCVVALIDNKKVTILNTLGRLDFYDQIVLQSMSTLNVQLLCDIWLDIVTVCMYLCISCSFVHSCRTYVYSCCSQLWEHVNHISCVSRVMEEVAEEFRIQINHNTLLHP